MYHLTSAQLAMVNNSIAWAIVAGVIIFSVLSLIMIFIFGLSSKEIGKNAKGFMMLAIISILSPILLQEIQHQSVINSQASISIKVVKIEVSKLKNNQYLLTLQLSEPASVFLEYKDNLSQIITSILAYDNLSKNTSHSFIINNVGEKGGEATLVINGKPFLINNKKITIK